MQSLDRLHRIGLASGEIVTYHLLAAQNTIDETVHRRLNEKQKNMLLLLEDDLPLGAFEIELYETERTDDEETVDFEEAIADIQKQYGSDL